MARLNNKAWQFLCAEVERCAANNPATGDVSRDLVLKRLEKMRVGKGALATEAEIREVVIDLFPNFSEKAIKSAAKANKGFSPLMIIPSLGLGLVGLAGLIWLVNLPYPMIRRPVAKTAPILLLPSYMSMDHNYREAIANVEQADQLVNKATSLADFQLGAEKVKQSQEHLNALPVWFLGYEPKAYCTFFGCSWKFTVDEFQQARAKIGRMEAQIFQETNAMTQLEEGETSLNQAKSQYEQAKNTQEQKSAIAAWQSALDTLEQLPSTTLAAKNAQSKLNAYQRDFQAVTGEVSASQRSDTIIAAAKQYAIAAAQASQNPPHPVAKWKQIEDLWKQAIQQLSQIRLEDSSYLEAQTLLASYQVNLNQIQLRREAETAAVTAFERAQSQTQSLLAATPDDPNLVDRPRTAAKLQAIINELSKVQNGTTVYPQAQEQLIFAQNKLKQLQ
ncbi:coiled-coil domain-containing protein [Oscillatoria salina]|uniref:hypothetical protein n=1 Tax=Oscillatoria salina TaxID=331517 RepID=UPI0013BA6D0C|nr:hypothetical protein [Oscillatoria salina]MBZ8181050.1 hypothetical protein [Oscillatoria salina IIICB1]NET90425.1 hypothetical protein [Kamptonema sp. SIO1D9]